MIYRRLGRTNFQVSFLGIGGGAFTGRFYGTVNPPAIIELIHYALDKGLKLCTHECGRFLDLFASLTDAWRFAGLTDSLY